jgi:hypothetical protein
MSTKLALILTGVWTLLVLAACGGGLWFVTTQVPRHQQEERARLFGSGTGTLAVIGYAAIIFPWAIAWGRQRREQRAEQARRKDRQKDTPPRRRRKAAKDGEET